MKLMKNKVIGLLSALLIVGTVEAQCTVVSGEAGSIHDSSEQVFIDYTTDIFGGSAYYTAPSYTKCGLTYPQIYTAWTGNAVEAGTIVYTFAQPIQSVGVFISGVGVDNLTLVEAFTFSTGNEDPVLTVDPGSCADWIIDGGTVTSPEVLGGLNAIATVFSATPFTTLTIVSSEGNDTNGGSFIGLCESSLIPASTVKIGEHEFIDNLVVYPNPNQGHTNIDLGKIHQSVEIQISDLTGKQLFIAQYSNHQFIELDIPYPAGTYLLQVRDGDASSFTKLIVH
jgi:hypothetical protein